MEAPGKIYIRTGMSGLFYGSKEKSFETDIEYIRKDILLEWLKEKIRDYWADDENTIEMYPYALEEVIHKLNSL